MVIGVPVRGNEQGVLGMGREVESENLVVGGGPYGVLSVGAKGPDTGIP